MASLPSDGDVAAAANGTIVCDVSPPAAKRPRAAITDAEIQAEFAHHDRSVARLNNGAFGCVPSSVLAARARWQRLFLSQPDAFYHHHLQPGLARSRAAVASAIGADSSSVSLVDNVTTAAAIVMQHVAWSFAEGDFSRGDAVLMFLYTYTSIKSSIHAYAARAGAAVVEVHLPFPLTSPSAIVAEFRAALAVARDGGRRRVRLAVIDHITSMPTVLIPVKDLVAICRDNGVDKVFVDAAHAIGQVDIDVGDIGADFYASNLHKWFFCPSAVAFLHTRTSSSAAAGDDPDDIASKLHHPVVSSQYGNGLPMESAWIGVRDYSAQLVVPDAVEFVARFDGGVEGIRRLNHDKVVEMGAMLAAAWGTFLGTPPEMCGSMVMVGLPGALGIEGEDDAMRLRTKLRRRFKVEVPLYYNPESAAAPPELSKDGNGDLVTGWVRISHQVYNKREDYEVLRDAVAKLVADGFCCAELRNSSDEEETLSRGVDIQPALPM